jgi:uncharacterized protein YbjT (DUF2867 family)
MDIVIAGGHGQIARRLTRRLAARGDRVRSLVRNPDHVLDCRSDGAEPVLLDLEEAELAHLTDAIAPADAVVFAAGAGPGSGAPRKETVDHGAAVLLLSAAQRAGIERYVMISAMGTDDPPTDDAVFSVYLRAKARADDEVMRSDRAWTIVRPGRLTDDPGTGQVRLARHVERGEVPRDDVAAVLAAVLARPDTAGHVFEVTSGDTPIEEAIDALARSPE